MRVNLTVQFDRKIDLVKHYISPGGFHVILADGTPFDFDFTEYCGSIDRDNRTILHCELRSEDTETFPGIESMRHRIHEIEVFEECYIYTGETEEETIHPVKLLSFEIIEGCEPDFSPLGTEFVDVDITRRGAKDSYIRYSFTEKLLETCKRFPAA